MIASEKESRLVGRRGVTLIEMVVVVAIAGAMAMIALPAFTSGLDSLRLSQASDTLASFLNGGINRAQRRQQPIDVAIAPLDNTIVLRSTDNTFSKRLALPEGIRIEGEARHVMLLPGGTSPGFGVQLANRRGRRNLVRIDPITGVPQIQRLDTP